ncbi:MAG: nucleoside triphosphate pyrophosphohydrolase [Patescibacteria group bacterium]|nr:nucleoside triphosphate pyrophosphohydrolase [Patescibacteria group bacterium]
MKTYNKLIRDRIPEIIAAKGEKAVTRILNDEEFGRALMAKLVEEAKEAEATAGDKTELTKEIGDVWEVIEALITHFGLDQQEIARIKAKRRAERGGFAKKIFLESVGGNK